jgi:hypothetical protein
MPKHTRETLDSMFPTDLPATSDGGELGIGLAANCHRTAGLRVFYLKAAGSLVIECAQCGEIVSEILVAERSPVPPPYTGPVQ